jgi:hypothetical protein
MQYKTIALELLKQRTQMYDQLRRERKLMEAMEACATWLKENHDAWKEQLAQARPTADPSQIASEAMELAVKDLEERLPPESPANDREPFSLDEAIAFLRRHTPPAS